MASEGAVSQRVDQWLWFSRVVKSRTGAQTMIERGKVRLNKQRLEKPSALVKAGDVLTVSAGHRIRVLEVLSIGRRRGPASEAQLLYADRSEAAAAPVGVVRRESKTRSAVYSNAVREGSGRPTKRDRRQLDRLKQSF